VPARRITERAAGGDGFSPLLLAVEGRGSAIGKCSAKLRVVGTARAPRRFTSTGRAARSFKLVGLKSAAHRMALGGAACFIKPPRTEHFLSKPRLCFRFVAPGFIATGGPARFRARHSSIGHSSC